MIDFYYYLFQNCYLKVDLTMMDIQLPGQLSGLSSGSVLKGG